MNPFSKLFEKRLKKDVFSEGKHFYRIVWRLSPDPNQIYIERPDKDGVPWSIYGNLSGGYFEVRDQCIRLRDELDATIDG